MSAPNIFLLVQLHSLRLEGFRNYASLSLEFDTPLLHLFIGQNGSGKTNLLESISILSLTRSCRGADEQDVVAFGQTFYRVRGKISSDQGEECTLEVTSESTPVKRKACFHNDVRIGVTDMVGLLPTVIFLPQELLLFSGPPAQRRAFLDQLLSQVSPEYLQCLGRYQKVLQQRNTLLKRIALKKDSAQSLPIWDRSLAHEGAAVTLARLELIETLNLTFAAELSSLGQPWKEAVLRYDRRTKERERASLQEEMERLLREGIDRDIALQSTGVGPHREDWQAFIDGHALPTVASRGQERIAVLSLLFLEVSYLELKRGEKPLILLDDALSELDEERQSLLLRALEGYQVILTATRLPHPIPGARVWEVVDGTVSPVQA